MRIAIHAAPEAMLGLRTAEPACMALAHLLEHADPDRTPISGLPGNPPRFVKDVGRAVALWWLANQQSPLTPTRWAQQWANSLIETFPNRRDELLAGAGGALSAVEPYLRDAHQIAATSVLAPHATTLEAYRRALAGMTRLLEHPTMRAGRASGKNNEI
jgi:glutathione S-transferase